MDWSADLQAEETVQWEGKPAPRCFVFRNWRHSVFGILLLLLASFWQMVGYQLQAAYHTSLLVWIPFPFVLAGVYLGMGHHLLARLEWEKVFYAVTDRRILARRGFFRRRLEVLELRDLTFFRVQPLGAELASFRISGGDPEKRIVLSCIEHPGRLTALLESALAANNRLERQSDMPASAATGKFP
jgi:hypothetical protein